MRYSVLLLTLLLSGLAVAASPSDRPPNLKPVPDGAPGPDDAPPVTIRPSRPHGARASRAVQWVPAGFRRYPKPPLLLSAAFAMLFGVVMALGLIPVAGSALSELASPLMVAGFLAAYRALDDGSELELPNFLAGVRGPAIPLMAVGAVQVLGPL